MPAGRCVCGHGEYRHTRQLVQHVNGRERKFPKACDVERRDGRRCSCLGYVEQPAIVDVTTART